jgi:hypothetical protein
MKRTVQIVLGITAILILAGNAPAQTTSAQITDYSHATGRPQAQCLGANLSVSRISEDAGVGNRAVNYAFTNTSSSPCTLKGYPGFALLDKRGRRLRGIQVSRSDATYFQPEQAPQEVTLEPGKTAWFQVAYSAVQSTPRKCPVSAKVKIIAPGSRRALIIADQLDPCGGGVTVTPVRSGLPPGGDPAEGQSDN